MDANQAKVILALDAAYRALSEIEDILPPEASDALEAVQTAITKCATPAQYDSVVRTAEAAKFPLFDPRCFDVVTDDGMSGPSRAVFHPWLAGVCTRWATYDRWAD
jgi:hypothetical protein